MTDDRRHTERDDGKARHERHIIHVDMDAFYASVEEREDPRLAGHPVIVGGTPEGRGVVAAANYIARRYGVHSAMPAGIARRLCPNGIFLRPRIAFYAHVSEEIRTIFERYTPLIEPLSLDEAFLDVTQSQKLHGSALMIAKKIRADIHDDLHLTASAGIGPNKYIAKIASDIDKPDGLVEVKPDQVMRFLAALPIERLWGVGRATAQQLKQLGIATIGDVQARSELLDHERFGALAEHIIALSRGNDDRPVTPDRQAKSISNETTFDTNITTTADLRPIMFALTEQVGARLRTAELVARTVNVKLRHPDFKTVTRSESLAAAVDATQPIWQAAWGLVERYIGHKPFALRLAGVGVSNLSQSRESQLTLFDSSEHEPVDSLADDINRKFGRGTIRRAGSLKSRSD